MANYIPLVLQIEILYRLPVKSLIRFRSVSKEWKSLIDSSEFNSVFIIGQPQRKRFLLTVSSDDDDDDDDDEHEKGEYCWIVDDDSFPQNRISLTYPKSVDPLLYQYGYCIKFVGSSHGLICFTSYYYYYSGEEGERFDRYVIWNPCIRKSVSIDHAPVDAPYYNYKDKDVFVGFGVCPKSLDPKIVRINICDNEHEHRIWQVEVYTLSAAGVWRSPLTELASEWFVISLTYAPPLVSNGFIYWSAFMKDDRYTSMIVSFDLATEKFTKILVPDRLAQRSFHLFKLRGCLGAVQIRESMDPNEETHEVWLAEDDVSKLLTELFTIRLPEGCEVVGFRDNGQIIIEKDEKHDVYLQGGVRGCEYRPELVAYDPNLKQIKALGLHETGCLSFTSSYTESLLLLNQSDAL